MRGEQIGFYKEKRKSIDWFAHTEVWIISIYAGLVLGAIINSTFNVVLILGFIMGIVITRLVLYLFSKSSFYKRVRK